MFHHFSVSHDRLMVHSIQILIIFTSKHTDIDEND